MTESCDVAVIGGGPAGTAAALTLRSHAPALKVVVLEAGRYGRAKPGEVLPALAGSVLDQLGIRIAFDAEDFVPARAIVSAWAGTETIERHSIFSAASHGWHLDRRRFDRLLGEAAAARGADLRLGRSVRTVAPAADGWELALPGEAAIQARQLIWATGRSWPLARRLGATVCVREERTAYIRYFRCGPSNGTTLIEARPEGWWYTADLPGDCRVVACISDPATARRLGLDSGTGWQRALRETRHISGAVGDEAVETGAMARAAGTVTLDPVCGSGWFAAGDAAFAPDPLSSQGLIRALRSGIFAAYAASDALRGAAEESRARYSALASQDVAAYRDSLRRHYSGVGQYADQAFWKEAVSGGERAYQTAEPIGSLTDNRCK